MTVQEKAEIKDSKPMDGFQILAPHHKHDCPEDVTQINLETLRVSVGTRPVNYDYKDFKCCGVLQTANLYWVEIDLTWYINKTYCQFCGHEPDGNDWEAGK